MNLLIVDDDRAVREACRAVAQSLGFSPHVAESAEQAYRLLDSRGADVILLDLKLPGARGLDALQTIRKHRPEALVIVVTRTACCAKPLSRARALAISSGARLRWKSFIALSPRRLRARIRC